MEIIPKYHHVIEKVRKIAKKFRKPKLYRCMLKYVGQKLQLDVCTRWNSTYFMLSTFIKNIDSIKKVAIDLKLKIEISEDEVERVNELISCLAPVYEGIKILSSRKANLMTADETVSKIVSDLNNIENSLAKKLCENIEDRYLSRRLEEVDYLWSLSGLQTQNIFCNKPSDIELKFFLDKFLITEANEESQPIDPIEASMCIAPRKSSKIDVEDIALQSLLSIRPSSTEVERLFSTCGAIVTPLRSKISTELLESLIIIKKY